MQIVFDDNVRLALLNMLGRTTNKDGFIIDKKTGEKELDHHGMPILFVDFAGVFNSRGKVMFFKSDLPTLLEIIDDLKEPL